MSSFSQLLASCILPTTEEITGFTPIKISTGLFVEIGDQPDTTDETKDGIYKKFESTKDKNVIFLKRGGRHYKSISGDLQFGSKFVSDGEIYTVGEHLGNGWYRIYDIYSNHKDLSVASLSKISTKRRYRVGKQIIEVLKDGISFMGKKFVGEPADLIQSASDTLDEPILNFDGSPVFME
jgi:hypothetical protein